jgi:succinoglycan biosynthesis protein ExoA
MTATLPFISVVIPMRNEAAHITRCIDSVLAQDYPAERVEVIVVDGESDDDSASVLAGYGDRIRVLSNPGRIVPTAMNIGIRAARGTIVARVDAHTVLEPSYLRSGVEALRRSGADDVGGPMRCTGGGPVGDAIASAMASRFGIGAYFHFATDDRDVDTVYMGMYPRHVFERIGLFDEELVRNQDDELNYRLRKAGGRIFLTTRMRSSYQNRQRWRTLARQFFQYGFWKVRVLQKHPRQMSWRQFVPPTFVLALLTSAVASPWSRLASGIFVVTLGTYAAAVTLASALVARTQGWRNLMRVLIAFAIMHFSWGAGFLIGALRFASRWFESELPPPTLMPNAAAGRSGGMGNCDFVAEGATPVREGES